MLGFQINHWYAATLQDNPPAGGIPVPIETFHHDVVVMPSGNLLALSSEVRRFEDYPTSVTDPDAPRAPTDVVGDILVEITPAGAVVRQWKLFDLLDPYRLGYASLDPNYWLTVYAAHYDPSPVDWHHGNGIDYLADEDAALISSNYMSAIYKLDLDSGQLEWILGDPTGWREPWSELLLEPQGELLWSYQHHAPVTTPQGTLLLYDNGGLRAIPPNPPIARGEDSFSRAVEYAIDETNGTVSQIWSFGGPGSEWFMSPFISEADWMPETGNVLVTAGGRVTRADGSVGMGPFEGRIWFTLYEVTHTSPADILWEVNFEHPEIGWGAYRTERVRGLYPNER
jgi:arylsulfate sulfotransferase